MCYYTSVKTTGSQLAKAIQAPFPKQDLFEPIYKANGFDHPDLPVLYIGPDGKSLDLFTWGLIPFWVKDITAAKKLWNQTLNAKSEEIFEKPSYRDSIHPTKGNRGLARRCIIPVTGFFEYKHIFESEGSTKVIEKIPHYIRPKEQEFFYLAGIYSTWQDPATRERIATFSILTTAANTLMAEIHNSAKRMPLMIDEGLISAWLDPELSKPGIVELMNPCDDSDMAAYPITKEFLKIDTAEVLEPANYGTN